MIWDHLGPLRTTWDRAHGTVWVQTGTWVWEAAGIHRVLAETQGAHGSSPKWSQVVTNGPQMVPNGPTWF